MAWDLFSVLAFLGLTNIAAAVSLTVSGSGGNATSAYQYGIMFEDINHSGDGGIYAELIQNRAFQGGILDPWTAVGGSSISLDTTSPLSSALPYSVKVTSGSSSGTSGIANPGYWGMDIKAANKYSGSFYSYGAYTGNFVVSIVSDITDEVFASATISSRSTADAWVEHTYELSPFRDAPSSNNSFVLQYVAAPGTTLNFNLISLFPPTYNNRPNGMRADLMEALKALRPSYLRAPGGNNLEGNASPYYWNWSATIGPLTDRPGRPGTWGYQNTDGLGLIEYMNWCTDLNMEPMLAVWSGLYLDGTVISEADLSFYIDDALNELEFLTGDASTTTYGALRASLGYPEPWTIKFVEVGNEDMLNNGLDSYEDYRFNMFYDAISAKYPDIVIMSSTTDYKYNTSGWDYHEYTTPDVFVSQFDYFDNWETGNPTMIGEYSVVQNNTGNLNGTNWDDPKISFPNWIGTVSEAVFLLGLERNSAPSKIYGASYAPLLQNLNSFEWTPDLISFTADPSQTLLSTSYSVVKLFSNNRMTSTFPATSDTAFGPAYWVTGEDAASYILKAAVYNSTADVPFSVSFPGFNRAAELTVLTANSPWSSNTPETPDSVITTTKTLFADAEGAFAFSLPDLSVAMLVVQK